MGSESPQIPELVAQISTGGQSQVAEAARRLCEFGVSGERGLMPRGTLQTAAGTIFPNGEDVERTLLNRWSSLAGKSHDWLTSALSLWGGAESAAAICGEVEHPQSRDSRIHAIRALGILGGPDAVTGLCIAIIDGDDDVARIADWHLKELAIGGSEDASRAVAAVSETYSKDVLQLIDWSRVYRLAERHLEGWYSGMCRLFDVLRSRTINVDPSTMKAALPFPWPRALANAVIGGARPVPKEIFAAAEQLVSLKPTTALPTKQSEWLRFANEATSKLVDELWTVAHCHLVGSRIPDCSALARQLHEDRPPEVILRTLQNAALHDDASDASYSEALDELESSMQPT